MSPVKQKLGVQLTGEESMLLHFLLKEANPLFFHQTCTSTLEWFLS